MKDASGQDLALQKRERGSSEADEGAASATKQSGGSETSARKRPSLGKVYKSAEFVHDSDLSDAEPSSSSSKLKVDSNADMEEKKSLKPPPSATSSNPRPPKAAPRSSNSSATPKKPASRKQYKSAEMVESDSDMNDGALDASTPKASEPTEPRDTTPRPDEDQNEESEPEIEEPPKKKARGKAKASEKPAKAKAEPKAKRGRKPAIELSKDEETVKRLKSLVVACGVRKIWTKEFDGLDTPSQQIKRLRAILTSLGMSGRMSLEQAKAIREKRDLARELEDVQKFGEAVASGRPFRSSRSGKKVEATAADNEGAGSGEESDIAANVPPKIKNNARKSIMAFLGDQSDDD